MEIDIEKIIMKIRKKIKSTWMFSLIIAIIATLFVWYFLPSFKYIIFKIENTDFMLRFIFTIIIWGAYFLFIIHNYYKKNNTKLPGVGFLINTSILKGENFEKEMFFKKFYENTKDKFKIIIYDKIKVPSDESIIKFLQSHNLNILFIIEEIEAKKNGDNFYRFNIKKVHFLSNANIIYKEELYYKLTNDIANAMNQYIEIYEKNNYDDSEIESNSLAYQIMYIISILYIISPTPEKAFKLLDELSYSINKSQKRNLRYIKKALPYRYIDTYINIILKITTFQKYYCDILILDNLKEYVKNAENHLNREFKNSRIKKSDYIEYKDILLNYKAIVQYEEKTIEDAILSIKKITSKPCNILVTQLNLAFLYGNKKEYDLSYEYYSKVLKNSDLNEEKYTNTINEVLDFINIRLDKNPYDEGLKFCSALTNIFFADKELGKEDLKNLAKQNEKIEKIYYKIYYKE